MIFADSDVLIDLLRDKPSAHRWLDTLTDEEEFVICGFSAFELLNGCQNKKDLGELQSHFIWQSRIVWPDSETMVKALDTFQTYKLSHGMQINDALIGHTALTFHTPIYTFNRKHFSIINGLEIIEPYRRK
ncbi:PIN domain protein [Leptospira santarosai str. 2000027870]|uniref:PIN domain-containing protein n=1 Tax=Leptospira santarosai TaxID=28183 RepID=UPI0002BDF25C|nr:PIN domain-containing protein [Leptospira santarosai]EMM84702.1 PIN domain protein [Leptospira santarosai str. 2000027870]MDI7235204.1 PIN domain-containing protein [Leptospira santarosai]